MCPVKVLAKVLVHSCSEKTRKKRKLDTPGGSQRLRESARVPYFWFVWFKLIAAVDKLKGNKFKESRMLTRTTEKVDYF